MQQLYPKDRLQPSLLDRLSDDEPHKKAEFRDQRVISLQDFKDCVMRDLKWLLNTGCLDTIQGLDDYPEVKTSVLNFGVPDFAGKTFNRKNHATLERVIRQTILDFEPRILAKSLKVRVADRDEHSSIIINIEAELWWQPMPEQLYLETVLDLELGKIDVKLDG